MKRDNEEREEKHVFVKDINEYNRRMEIIQSRIDASAMLGLGTIEYEKRAERPVLLGKSLLIEDDDGTFQIHTIKQWKSKEGNTCVSIDMNVWENMEGSL